MSNFVEDNTSLPFPKSDLVAVPAGADTSKYVAAGEWNTVCQGLTDTKGVLRGAKWFGLTPQASDPVPAGVSEYVWLKSDGHLYLTSGGAATQIDGGAGSVGTPDGVTITGAGTNLSPFVAVEHWFNVKKYGAVGDGSTDDSVAIRATRDAAASAGGGVVFFPEGTYKISSDGSNFYCVRVAADNLEFRGVKGRSVVTLASGTTQAVKMFQVDGVDRVSFRDLIIDGNWGNAVTAISETSDGSAATASTWNVDDTTGFASSGTLTYVNRFGAQTITYTGLTPTSFTGCTGGSGTLKRGQAIIYVDGNNPINQVSGETNSAIVYIGCTKGVVDGCEIRNVYGDAIYFGTGTAGPWQACRDMRVSDTTIRLTARDGIAVGQSTDGLVVENVIVETPYAQAFDTEPDGYTLYARNVRISRCTLGLWANPYLGTADSPLSIAGYGGSPGPENLARGYRVEHCVIEGNVIIGNAADVVVANNRILADWAGNSGPAVSISGFADNVTIERNEVYSRTTSSGVGHTAVISVGFYSPNRQPAGVHILRNRIYARGNLTYAVDINGVGGQAFGSSLLVPETNTATSVTSTTMVRTGATWTTNEWAGWRVRIGNVDGGVISNTSDTLTLTGWFDVYAGSSAPTPPAGTYVMSIATGVVSVVDNEIDCTDDGNGNGGYGIIVRSNLPGGRVCVSRNRIRNASGYGVYVSAATSTMPIDHLEVSDNIGWDDQATPTMTALVDVDSTAYINKLILRNNSVSGPHPSIAPMVALSGAAQTHVWLVNDGLVQQWAGYGSPESVVAANIGSTYVRLDGGSGTSFYVKESGTGNTGWTAK